jgi:hypothetical protein
MLELGGQVRTFTKRLLVVAAVGLLAAALVPVASAAGPKDHFKPSATTAPWAMEGDDETLDNANDAFGLCRTAVDASLPFSYPAPTAAEVNAIVSDPINNSGASNYGCTTPQNETSIAVNPTDVGNLIAGANDYRVCCDRDGLNDGTGWAYYSNDGGQTWGNVQLPGLTVQTGGAGNFKLMDSAGDPVLAFGPDGTAYYANIVFSRGSPASGIAVSVSRDGGASWSTPNMVAFSKSANFFYDKEWIGAGADGRVVVTWTTFVSDGQGAYKASTINGGISYDRGKTWNRQGFPVSDAAHPYNQGSQIAFAPNGDLFVAYEASSPATDYATDALVLARSTDDGKTFENVELARVYDDYDCYPMFGGRQTLTNQHFRLNSYPSMAIDPSGSAAGDIAIVWSDNEGVGTCGQGGYTFVGHTAARVKLVTGTWGSLSGPQAITPADKDTTFPSVGLNQGRVAVGYYVVDTGSANPACHVKIPDSGAAGALWEPTADSVCLHYAMRVSDNGFNPGFFLTSQPSNPYVQFANGSFIGDYSQVAVGPNGVAHAAWTDFRGRPGTNGPNQDVYVRSFSPS